jgi:hypothetical protein
MPSTVGCNCKAMCVAEAETDCREARQAKEEAHALLRSKQGPVGVAESGRKSTLEVGSSLKFTPITVCWRDLSYYVPVPKGLTGAAALNVMPPDAAEDIAGKKRLLNSITGVQAILDCG